MLIDASHRNYGQLNNNKKTGSRNALSCTHVAEKRTYLAHVLTPKSIAHMLLKCVHCIFNMSGTQSNSCFT